VGALTGLLEFVAAVVFLGAVIFGVVFAGATLFAGGSPGKPNGGQQTTNVHVEVNVGALTGPAVMPAADYQAALHAQAAHLAALHARAAAAELYGPPVYHQPITSASAYGQIPYGHTSPALDPATVDRAVDAAIERRIALPPGSQS
jgi:hypothetical protein